MSQDNFDLRVMPGNAHLESNTAQSQKEKKGNSLLWIFVLIFLLLVIGVAVYGFYSLLSQQQATPVLNSGTKNTDTHTQNTEAPIETPDQNTPILTDVSLFDLNTPSGRDAQKIQDVKSIGDQLSAFFENQKKYPSILSDIENQDWKLPFRTSAEKIEYTVLEDGKSFQLSFVLEEGARDGFQTLSVGNYVLTPNGIQTQNTSSNVTDTVLDPLNSEVPVEDTSTNLPPQLSESLDTDFDGLTDFEEVIFQTDNRRADSDNDNFIDSVEVLNLYDPTALDRNIEAHSAIKRYTNNEFRFTFLYPGSWNLNVMDQGRSVVIDIPTGEKFQLLIQDNPNALSALDWYLSQSPGVSANNLQEINKGSVRGVKTLDGLHMYFADKSYVYVLSYNLQLQKELRYQKIFEMLNRSLIFN